MKRRVVIISLLLMMAPMPALAQGSPSVEVPSGDQELEFRGYANEKKEGVFVAYLQLTAKGDDIDSFRFTKQELKRVGKGRGEISRTRVKFAGDKTLRQDRPKTFPVIITAFVKEPGTFEGEAEIVSTGQPTFDNPEPIKLRLKARPLPSTAAQASPSEAGAGLKVAVLIVVGIIIVILLIGLFWSGKRTGTLAKDQRTWLDYGNFFIVATGLAGVLLGFLIVLQFIPPADGPQALGYLTALFGAIAGLVGTFFGVKQSADARVGAENLALTGGVGATAPTVKINPPTATIPVSNPHEVTATVTSVDGSPAAHVAVAFTVTDGPDVNTTGTEMTNEFGQATFQFNNNGVAGPDTIEAIALEGRDTATVEFS